MAYSDKVLDHYENPRNVGKMNAEDEDVDFVHMMAERMTQRVYKRGEIVYRKGDAVRKLVVTERAADDETIPFVLYFTDFSPARKDPLKVTTQYAFTKQRRDLLVERLLEKNVKKGWEEVG